MHNILFEINFPKLDDSFEEEYETFPLGVAAYITLVQLENRLNAKLNDIVFEADKIA